jgi:probable HAF family extracellular repeat protein
MRDIVRLLVLAAVCGCGSEPETTQPHTARPNLAAAPSYQVTKVTTSLGGSPNRGMAINSQGWVAGFSTKADGTRRAVVWRNGVITDLLTLGGPNSTVPWPGLNDAGMIVGISHTSRPDPLHEDWSCDLGGFLPQTTDLICSGFFWQNGLMHELPTLGGNHSFAAGVNNSGQIVGWAETAAHDPTCVDAQVLGFKAVVWEPKSGTSASMKPRQLRPLPGDAASAATAINDLGQAVGISGACDQAVGRFTALHAVLWDENGKPTELPNLGGKTWHTPMDINAAEDVVGFSNPPGENPEGDFIAQAFLWPHGAATVTPLGTLDDDPLSQAFAINGHGQVVGISFGGAAGGRAFLWQDGALYNLNDLVDIAPDVLVSAQDINDDGQITGRVRDGVTGEQFMFVATPVE